MDKLTRTVTLILIVAGLILCCVSHCSNNDDYLRKEYIQSLVVELPEEIHEATIEDTLIAVKRNDTIFIMYN